MSKVPIGKEGKGQQKQRQKHGEKQEEQRSGDGGTEKEKEKKEVGHAKSYASVAGAAESVGGDAPVPIGTLTLPLMCLYPSNLYFSFNISSSCTHLIIFTH